MLSKRSYHQALILLLLLVLSSYSFAETPLIKDVENLRNSIGLTDRQRPRLTLRLADLHFDHANELRQKEAEQGVLQASAKVTRIRKTALKYYETALSGENGKFSKPNALTQFKIHFQIARLNHKLKRLGKAIKHYETLLDLRVQNQKIIRETVLNLAEIFEEKQVLEKADQYYVQALKLCEKKETCSYINYRRSWIYYRKGDFVSAINTIKKGLLDSHGNIKDQALQDYLMFVSQSQTDGEKELIEFEAFAKKYNRPNIMTALMEGFFGQGNRLAGMKFLTYLNNKKPNLIYEIRLLEETYGFRNWEAYNEYLERAQPHVSQKMSKEEETKANKILKRLVVQLDGERKTDPEKASSLMNTIELYLTLFKNDPLRDKMTNGWMAALSQDKKTDKVSPEVRAKLIEKIKIWIDEEISFKRQKRVEELRIKRLSLAQKDENHGVVKVESQALTEIYKTIGNQKKYREYQYILARTHYQQKEMDKALPLFVSLADLKEAKTIDKWALLSQNLSLDILNQKKNFAGIVKQASLWLSNPSFKGHKEFKEMTKISKQAQFQVAFSAKESPESLETFRNYCLRDQFKDKSCENAKILAIKLKNQKVLIEILNKLKDEDALLVEYEAMGEFKKVAYLLEKRTKKFDLKEYAKIALFYEIAMDLKQRDRILRKIVSHFKKKKKIDEKVAAFVYATLNDADMIDHKILSLPWSLSKKMEIIHELELRGKGNKSTKKKLLASKSTLGDRWSLHVLEKISSKFKPLKKYGFHGRSSQKRFKRRISKIKSFVKASKNYLEGADLRTRVIILGMMEKSYSDLVEEILNTPLPEGLDEEQVKQVQTSLADMAAPFKLESENFKASKDEQLAEIKDEELKGKLIAENIDYKDIFNQKAELPTYIKDIDLAPVQADFDTLRKSPNDKTALTNIHKFYEDNKQSRIANYFKGRMLSL